MALDPDRIKEFSETEHHEFDVGKSTNVAELKYLAEQENNNDAYGATVIIEYEDKEGNIKFVQTEIYAIDDMDALYDAVGELQDTYSIDNISGITVSFIS